MWIAALVGIGAPAHGVYGVATSGDEARAEIRADLPPRVIPIDAHLPAVPINRLDVHIWTTHGNDLRRMIKFRMEQERVDAPIEWCRGNGVLGVAWERGRRVTADLSALYEEAEKMDPATFDALDREHRWGLTHHEVLTGARYKSVLPWPLTARSFTSW